MTAIMDIMDIMHIMDIMDIIEDFLISMMDIRFIRDFCL
jgi:hypothetical protein